MQFKSDYPITILDFNRIKFCNITNDVAKINRTKNPNNHDEYTTYHNVYDHIIIRSEKEKTEFSGKPADAINNATIYKYVVSRWFFSHFTEMNRMIRLHMVCLFVYG